MVIRETRHGHFAINATLHRKRMHQADTAQFLGHAVGANTVEEGLRIWPAHIIFRKAGQVEHANPLSNRLYLCRDRVKAVGAVIAAFFFCAVEGKIFGPLPTVGFAIYRASRQQTAI